MHEIIGDEKIRTQEDFNQAQLKISKIRKDPWFDQAVKISKKYDLLGGMGIEQEKVSFFIFLNSYLAIRLCRRKIYNNEPWGLVEDTKNRKMLESLEDSTRWFIDTLFHTSIEDRNKVRTIELAVNALVAGATSFNESKLKTEIVFDPRFLSDWGTRWSNEIRQRNTA